MPELPEVETIVRELDRAITGKTISRFLVYDTKRIVAPRLRLPQKIKSVSRHGKYIVCETTGDQRCLVHLRMTGELLLVDKKSTSKKNRGVSTQLEDHARDKHDEKLGALNSEPGRHERARFHFTDGSILRLIDIRRFGTIEWRGRQKPLPELGFDPLFTTFTSKKFKDLLNNSSRQIKSFLLDQQKIAGIGNIYSDEALWHAGIMPTRKAGGLIATEAGRLVRAIKKVLNEGIKKGGFTLRDYRRIDGSFGYYQKSRKVYNREDLPCFRCRAKIKRIKVGGRSSYFCPKCQR